VTIEAEEVSTVENRSSPFRNTAIFLNHCSEFSLERTGHGLLTLARLLLILTIEGWLVYIYSSSWVDSFQDLDQEWNFGLYMLDQDIDFWFLAHTHKEFLPAGLSSIGLLVAKTPLSQLELYRTWFSKWLQGGITPCALYAACVLVA